jgi:hypothetical protein
MICRDELIISLKERFSIQRNAIAVSPVSEIVPFSNWNSASRRGLH